MDTRPKTSSSELTLLESHSGKFSVPPTDGPNYDEAFKFLQVASANFASQPAIIVKIDRHAMVDDILTDLEVGNKDGQLIPAISASTCLLGSFLSAFILVKAPASTWLAGNALAWGVVVGCTAATTSTVSFITCRALAGLLQAATIPCLTVLLASWYRKSEQALRFCMLFTAIGTAKVAAPFICYGLAEIYSPTFASWRIMSIVIGILGLLTGFWILLALSNDPMAAAGHLLCSQETVALLNYMSSNRTTIRNRTFTKSHIRAMLSDPQVLVLGLLVATASISYSMAEFATSRTTLLDSPDDSRALILTCTGVPALVVTIGVGLLLQYTRLNRIACLFGLLILVTVGAILFSFSNTSPGMNIQNSATGLVYAIITLSNISIAGTAVVLSFAAANIAGSTKRTVSISLIAAGFAFGKVCSVFICFSFPSNVDFPQAGLVFLACSVASILLVLVLCGWYVLANARKLAYEKAIRQRDREHGYSVIKPHGDQWMDRTDQEDEEFFYDY
ncbi:putative allantoate permease [Phaeomoniella chlamydospora]|uniref:Putative allantoate permease n=1 Tax=Phaeomoniella chlamydospora TaxID=158046 RepID=A0A0G2F1B0_PHACM|nr:putative allantoate permease [Phaeomoniella chlamydospora]